MFTSYHIPETIPCIYLVSAYGDEWEDSWETPLQAFFDREEAETFAKDYEDELLHPKVDISEEEWNKLESLIDYDILSDEESDLDSAHLIHLQKLSPYSLEQLQQASKAWDDYRYHDFGGTQVEQVPISIPDNMDTVIMKFQKQIEQQNNHPIQKQQPNNGYSPRNIS